jgi:hypothetical protein
MASTPPDVLAALITEVNEATRTHGNSGTSRVLIAEIARRYGQQALADAVAYEKTRQALLGSDQGGHL